MALQEGTLLQGGKYQIRRFIGSGGFGCTYEAYHSLMDSRVCIKEFFVKDFCNRDERTGEVTVGTQSKTDLVDRLKKKFVEEAQAIFKLKHPSIVSVTDVFIENGTAYYVMDYIDGPSLEGVIEKQGRLTEAQAVYYLRQIADALAYVHSNNRLHLDIKPANIMIAPGDRAVIIDFGVSKQYDEVRGENTSSLLGFSPGYAPLEQLGQSVGNFLPATDIYALGATFYKALTGNTPIMANIRSSEELELEPLPPEISPNTREAITRALMLGKKQRPQSIAEFIAILDGQKPNMVAATPKPVRTQVPIPVQQPMAQPVSPQPVQPVQPVPVPSVQTPVQPMPVQGGGNMPPVGPSNSNYNQTQIFDDDYYDDEEDERRKKRTMWLIISGIAVVAIIVLILLLPGSKEEPTDAIAPVDTAEVDSLNNEEVLAEAEVPVVSQNKEETSVPSVQSTPATTTTTVATPTETKPQTPEKTIKFTLEAPSNANVGEMVLVTYQLVNAEAITPQAPSISNCTLSSGPRISQGTYRERVGGEIVVNSYVDYVFSYTADKAGVVTIPALTIKVDGKNYTSNSIQLNIKGSSTSSNAQQTQTETTSNEIVSSTSVDSQPMFPGGQAAMYKWLSDHLNYPVEAADNKIQGRVTVGFVVKADGTIVNVRVIRGCDPSLDKEAIRLVNSMPKWEPGKKNGKNVNVEYTLPIAFRL